MMGAWDMGFGGWGWISMLLMMGWVWIPIVALLVWLVTRSAGSSARQPAEREEQPHATEIARRAYARGEITRERYLQLIDDLREPRVSGAPATPR